MVKNRLVIVGSGGFGREVATLVEDINRRAATFDLCGFVNTDVDDPSGQVIDGHRLIPRAEFFASLSGDFGDGLNIALGVGFPRAKKTIVEDLRQRRAGLVWPNLVHPSVILSQRVRLIGEGIIITAGNILTTNIELESFAMINLQCTVGHDATIKRYAVLSPGVCVSGGVSIAEGATVGTGAKVIEQKRIGAWSVIGAGAVVTSDIPDGATAVGVPARVIKVRDN